MSNERRIVAIEFTRPKGGFKPLSWLIRKISRSEFSHVRLRWMGVGQTVDVIYEASGTSLKFIGPIASKYKPVTIVDSYKFNLDMDSYTMTVLLCMNYAGIEYGKKQLLGMGIARVFRLKKNPFADGKKSQVCSEVVGYFLEKILGWDTGLDLDVAGPKEIRETIIKHKGK